MNLKPLVNDKTLYKDFLEEIENRLSLVHTQLEQNLDTQELLRLQGEARALRKFLKLREAVNNG
jgi:hypothetical protein